MKNSIFWRMVIIVLPFVMLATVIIMFVAYALVYDSTVNHCHEDVREAARMAANYFEKYDPDDYSDSKECSKEFDNLCDILNVTYISAIRLDLEKDNITYLAIGFGKEASEKAKEDRFPGVVVSGIYDEEKEALNGNDDVYRIEQNSMDYTLIGYAPVKRHYDSNTNTIVEGNSNCIVCAEMKISDLVASFRTKLVWIAFLLLLSIIPVLILIAFLFRKMVSKPAEIISKRMTDFVSESNKEFEAIEIHGSDEFAQMSQSFNKMAEDIRKYLDNITALNNERAKQEAELNIARNIQMGLLNPTPFSCDAAEINACMLPAKDVGGDLYDYIVLGDGSICVIIADVSGKGISAALFMSHAITLLRQCAEAGLDPGCILREYNNHLSDHNPNTMFITTFVGIYNLKTQELVYSNAGHNTPYILSDELIALDGAGGMAAGIFRDKKYPEARVKLKAGDTLFLYTDGITEAKNSDNKLFGDEALRRVLKNNLYSSGKKAMDEVLEQVEAFSGGGVQSDDITILTMTVKDTSRKTFRVEAKKENMTGIIDHINTLDISDPDKKDLRLITEEMFVNICSYAYENGEGEAEITIETCDNSVRLTFTDSGKAFDPTENVKDIKDYDMENDVGGLGRFITFELADEYSYERTNGKNILTIVKKCRN